MRMKVLAAVESAGMPVAVDDVALALRCDPRSIYSRLQTLCMNGKLNRIGRGHKRRIFYVPATAAGERLIREWVEKELLSSLRLSVRPVLFSTLLDRVRADPDVVQVGIDQLCAKGSLVKVTIGAQCKPRYILAEKYRAKPRPARAKLSVVYRRCTLGDGHRGTEWQLREGSTTVAQCMHLHKTDAVACAERYLRIRQKALEPLRGDLGSIEI